MKRIISAILLLAALGGGARAQKADNRTLIYLGAGLEKEFCKKLSAGVDAESRFCKSENSQEILLTPSIEYSPAKFLALGAEYRVSYEHEKGKDSEWQGRFGAMAKAKVSPWILKLEARAKYCNYSEDYDDGSSLQYLRTRLEASAKIKAAKLTPYVGYEWFYNLSRSVVDKDRFAVGLKKKFSKRNSVGIEYMLEEKFNRGKSKRDINKHIFALSYQYTFPDSKKSAKKQEGKDAANEKNSTNK